MLQSPTAFANSAEEAAAAPEEDHGPRAPIGMGRSGPATPCAIVEMPADVPTFRAIERMSCITRSGSCATPSMLDTGGHFSAEWMRFPAVSKVPFSCCSPSLGSVRTPERRRRCGRTPDRSRRPLRRRIPRFRRRQHQRNSGAAAPVIAFLQRGSWGRRPRPRRQEAPARPVLPRLRVAGYSP